MSKISEPYPKPRYDYIAYIDESGDDGLRRVKPLDRNGASEWLVLSAVVIAATREKETVTWVKGIISQMRHHQRKGLHFKHLNAAKKRKVCTELAGLPVRCFVVASNKKNMRGYRNPFAEIIPSQNWFYCWLTRLLLERVTHFVEQRSNKDFGLVRKLKVEYSNRGGLSYAQMSAYYDWLRMKSSGKNLYLPLGDLSWSVMHRDLLEVHNHQDRAGLQLADIVAGAFFKACDVFDTGNCDPVFAKLLEPKMARYPDTSDGQISGYGVKLMPNWRKAQLRNDQQEVFRFYGYPRQWWAPASPDSPANSPAS